MVNIRDFAVTEYGTSTTASLVCDMPVHEANDILIYFASKDGTPTINATAGWTAIQDGVSAGMAYRCMWKLATSSSETLTVVTGTAENWTVVVIAIKGANTSSPISASAESASDDSSMPFAGPSTSTGTDTNCLILHAWFTDSGLSPTAYAPLVNLYAGDNGANSTGVAYTYQKAAGSVTAGSWFGRANDDGRGVVVAVKDNGSETEVPGYSDSAISSGQVLRPLVGLTTTFGDSWPTFLTLTYLGDDFDAAYTDVGPGVFTDIKSALNNASAADVTFPTATTDFVYFGSDNPFRYLNFYVSIAGVAGAITWEYYTSSVWSSTGMPTDNLTSTGWRKLDLGNTIRAAMAQTTVNSVEKYWVRANISTLYTTAIVLSQGRIDGYVAAYIVATAAADAGTNPYTDATQNAGGSSTTTLNGPQINFGSALDMDTGIIMGTIRPVLPRDFAIDIALPDQPCGGVQLTFLDASDYYASYKIGAKGCKTLDVNGRNVFAIDWNGSAVPWALRDSINKSAVTKLYLSTFGYFGACAVQWSMLSLVTRIGIAGGSTSLPLDLDAIANVANNCIGIFPFMKLIGGAAQIFAPLQFGGGDPVRVNCDLNTFIFPHTYDGEDYFDWNVAENVAGIKFYPKSGDELYFTNCVFSGPSPYRFEFDSSSAAVSGSFTGSFVVGATVDLYPAFDFDGMTFVNCPSFEQHGSTIKNSTIQGTKILSDDPEELESNEFVSGGSGHGIEITSPGTYSFVGNMFTGFGSGGTTDAAIYNNSGGAVVLNISGGGDIPTVRNGTSSSTTINSIKTLTLTGLVANSEVRIYTHGTTTELDGVENSSTSFDYEYNYVADTYVDIVVHKADRIYWRLENYLLLNSDSSLPVQQLTDRQYNNPT